MCLCTELFFSFGGWGMAVFSQFMKKSIFEFFINYEKTALQIFFLLYKDVLW